MGSHYWLQKQAISPVFEAASLIPILASNELLRALMKVQGSSIFKAVTLYSRFFHSQHLFRSVQLSYFIFFNGSCFLVFYNNLLSYPIQTLAVSWIMPFLEHIFVMYHSSSFGLQIIFVCNLESPDCGFLLLRFSRYKSLHDQGLLV